MSKLKDMAPPLTAQKKREDISMQKDQSGCKEIKGKQAVHAPEECRAWGKLAFISQIGCLLLSEGR